MCYMLLGEDFIQYLTKIMIQYRMLDQTRI